MARLILLAVGVFAIALGVVLLVAPQVYLSLYLTDVSNDMGFAAQRLSPAIMGLGALLLAARTLPKGPFAVMFFGLTSLVWFGVAATGVYHYATGVASSNILVAAVTEVVLGAVFVMLSFQYKADRT